MEIPYVFINKRSIIPLNNKPYKKLIIGMGGSKGYLYLGILHYLFTHYKEHIDLQYIDTFAGTSIGSIICLCLNIGLTPLQILQELLNIKFSFDININNIVKDFGLIDIGELIKHLSQVIINKYNYIPTLYQLYKITGKTFISNSYNLNTHNIVYFSYKTHPDILCTDVVSMSCNIPFLFKKILYKNEHYIDAGVVEPFLGNYILNNLSNNINSDNILGVYYKNININMNFIQYIHDICIIPFMSRCKTTTNDKYNSLFIEINIKERILDTIADIGKVINNNNNKYKFEYFVKGILCMTKIRYKDKIKIE